MRAPLPQPLLTPRELFALFIAAADSVRAGIPRELRLYLGDARMVRRQTGEQLGDAYLPLLPRAADRTLARYGERLRRRGYPCFALMLNNSQVLSPILWARVRDFAAGLVEARGVLPGGMDANLFAGNYRRTPFGVHTDELDVFTWIVEGKKRFLLWPKEALDPLFAPPPGGAAPRQPHRYADLRGRAQRLDGEAGDLLYWPRQYWHVAEAGAGQLSATLSIGHDPSLPGQAWARELLGNLAALAVGPPAEPPRGRSALSGNRTTRAAQSRRAVRDELPPDLTRLVAAVSEGSLARRFERDLRLRWMCWITGYGLRTPPGADVRAPRPTDLVRGDVRWPLRVVEWNGHHLIGTNGYSFAVPSWPTLDSLLTHLGSGEVVRIGDLYSSLSPDVQSPRLQALLSALLACRALAYVEREAARQMRRD